MNRRTLFIEDNKEKAEDISDFLNKSFGIRCTLMDSYRGGLKEIISNEYDLLLLDMSLPTREMNAKTNTEGYEKLGGYIILKEMKRKKKKIPTILVTMFHEFGVGESFLNYKELDKICKTEFGDFFLGSVFYSSKENKWKDDLLKLIPSND